MIKLISFIFLYINIYLIYGDIDKWPSTENDHSVLQVVVPFKLQKQGGYAHRDALFGYPNYSKGSLVTPLINGNSTGCNNTLDFNSIQSPYAVLLNRGECHFVQKVRNAQHAGASAVIIVDNTCLCTDTECMRETGDTSCEAVLPFMADDESGGDITIPSMLIRKSDGKKIKEAIGGSTEKSNVMVQFDWGIPSPDGRVEWTMWHSSWDDISLDALKELYPIVDALGNRSHFTPRFVSYNGSNVGCHSDVTNDACGNMCMNKGRYCLLDPSKNHNQEDGASGADIVLENLRRKCIWNITSIEDPGVGRKWWKYVIAFGEKCNSNENNFVHHNCANDIMKSLGIDIEKVEKCTQPVGLDVDKANAYLEEELKEQTDLQLLRLPALYVDGVHARGHLNGALALSMICSGYGSHSPPKVCECSDVNKMELLDCVKQGKYETLSEKINSSSSPKSKSSSSILWPLMMFGCIGFIGLVHYKRSQRHMRDEVRSILAEYMPLEDQSESYDMDSPRLHPAAVASAKSPRGFLPSRDINELDDDCA